jgi:type I restriction enzyme S subunit
MIEGLKPYPRYQGIDLKWLNFVPSGWEVRRAKGVFKSIDVRSKTGKEELLTVSSSSGVVPRSQKAVNMFMAKSYVGHKLCWPGDLVINSLWAWMQGLGVSCNHGMISSAYGVYRPRREFDGYGRYFHYLLRSAAYKLELQARSKGVWISRLQLSDVAFMDMPLLLPPRDEQDAIVRFLDHANHQLEKAIRAKQKVIKLLNEQKQVIIHRAVTRGLDPEVRLKPSGIDWWGEIPEHWETVLLGRCLTKIEQGWSPVASEGDLEDHQWAVLTLSSVRRGEFNPRAIKPIPLNAEVPKGLEIQEGDFLLTRSNTRERVGDVCVVENVRLRTIMSDLIYRLTVDRSAMDSRFLMYGILSLGGRQQIEKSARGASGTMPKLAQRHIRSIRLPRPPIPEQKEISRHLDGEMSSISSMTDHIESEIALLQEYRTRLIADVVTGKLDVREFAAGLPDLKDAAEWPATAEGTEEWGDGDAGVIPEEFEA